MSLCRNGRCPQGHWGQLHLRLSSFRVRSCRRSRRGLTPHPDLKLRDPAARTTLTGWVTFPRRRAPPPVTAPQTAHCWSLHTPSQALERLCPQLSGPITHRVLLPASLPSLASQPSGCTSHGPCIVTGAPRGLQDARRGIQGIQRAASGLPWSIQSHPPGSPFPAPVTLGTEKQNLHCWDELQH